MPPGVMDPPVAEVTRDRLQRAIEAPETMPTVERRDNEERLAHALDNADLENLLAVIREADTVRRLESEAAETIEQAVSVTPKLQETLLSPQSPDKHAEGPLLEDHLRLILVHIKALVENKIRLEELPEFARAIDQLSAEPASYVRVELKRVEDIIKKQPAFFEIFGLYHDLAKPDTLGFAARDKKPVDRAQFFSLLDEFARERPELLITPARFQEEFFNTYGISLNNYRHGEIAAETHEEIIRRASEARELLMGDQDIMLRLIELHIEPHARFVNGPDAQGFGRLMKKFEGLQREPREVIRMLRAGALLDVLGTKRIAADGSRESQVELAVNFMLAERAYDELLAETAKRDAYKAAAREAGFTSAWLITDLGLRDRAIGEAQRAVEAAVAGAALELPPSLETHRSVLDSKVSAIRTILKKN